MLVRGGQKLTILNRTVTKGSMEKVIFDQRLEGSEGVSHMGIWGRAFQGKEIATSQKHVCVNSSPCFMTS